MFPVELSQMSFIKIPVHAHINTHALLMSEMCIYEQLQSLINNNLRTLHIKLWLLLNCGIVMSRLNPSQMKAVLSI